MRIICFMRGLLYIGTDAMAAKFCVIVDNNHAITVYIYGFLFKCTMVGQDIDSLIDLDYLWALFFVSS